MKLLLLLLCLLCLINEFWFAVNAESSNATVLREVKPTKVQKIAPSTKGPPEKRRNNAENDTRTTVVKLNRKPKPDPKPYDYLILALTWIPGFCKSSNKCSKQFPERWSVHGLWPSTRTGGSPAYCKSTHKIRSPISQQIQTVLGDRMFSPKGNRVSSRYWYQWEKHGSCAAGVNTSVAEPLAYFTKMAKLYDDVGLRALLESNNIFPHNTSLYELSRIEEAIKSRVNNKNVRVTCGTQVIGQIQKVVISEVRICYDPITIEPVDCKGGRHSTCQDNVHYVPK